MAVPSPSKHCWNEEIRLAQGKVYSPAQATTLLGGWEKRGEITADHINCPKSFVPHCRWSSAEGEWNSKSPIATETVSWSELHVLGFSSGVRLVKQLLGPSFLDVCLKNE